VRNSDVDQVGLKVLITETSLERGIAEAARDWVKFAGRPRRGGEPEPFMLLRKGDHCPVGRARNAGFIVS
jgi:hypothetical protein